MKKIGRKCFVCNSPYRNEYEKLYLPPNNWTVKDIWKYSIKKYKEKIPYESFRKHMKYHVKDIIEARTKASKLQDEKVKEEIYKTIEISQNLRKNLERIQDIIDKKIDTLDTDKDIELLLKVMQEGRQLYKLILEYSEKIDIGPKVDKDSIYDRVLECLIATEVPDSYLYKFNEEWNELNKEKIK